MLASHSSYAFYSLAFTLLMSALKTKMKKTKNGLIRDLGPVWFSPSYSPSSFASSTWLGKQSRSPYDFPEEKQQKDKREICRENVISTLLKKGKKSDYDRMQTE